MTEPNTVIEETKSSTWCWYSTRIVANKVRKACVTTNPTINIGPVVECIIHNNVMFGFRIPK